jgi:hypothetical protein
VPIPYIKGLGFCSVIVINELAVGHNPIHIEDKNLHAFNARPDLGVKASDNRRGLDRLFSTRLF